MMIFYPYKGVVMPDENQTVAGNGQAGQGSQSAVIQPGDDFILDFGDGENNEEVKMESTQTDTHDAESNLNNDKVEEERQENVIEGGEVQSESGVTSPINQEDTQTQGDFDITLGEDETGGSMETHVSGNDNEGVVDEIIPTNTEDYVKDNSENDMAEINVVDNSQETAELSGENYTDQVEVVQEDAEPPMVQEDTEPKDDNSMTSSADAELPSNGILESENGEELNENILGENGVVEKDVINFQDGMDPQIAEETSVGGYDNENGESEILDNQVTYDFSDSNQDNEETQNNIPADEVQVMESNVLDEGIQQDNAEEYKDESSNINLNEESINDVDGESENENNNLDDNNNEAQDFTLDLTGSTDLQGESHIESNESEYEQSVSNQDINNGFLLDDYNDMENVPELHEEAEDINVQEEKKDLDEQPELTQDYNETNVATEEGESDFKPDLGSNNEKDVVNNMQSEVSMLPEENNENFVSDQESKAEDVIDNDIQESASFPYEQNTSIEESASNQLVENSQVVTENTIVDNATITPNEKEEDIAGSIGVSGFAEKLKEISTSTTSASVEQAEHKEVQSTLSLDQILDSELTSNPQLANNSTAVPVNTPVHSSFFSNKKVVGIIAGVGIFLLLGFVAALAFPTGNKDRDPNEVVTENPGYESESTEEHGSAPTDPSNVDVPYTEGNSNVDPYTNSGNNTNTGEDLKPTSTVYFPVAEDPTETEYEQPILEPEPYICTDCLTGEVEGQEDPFEVEKEIYIEKIRLDISSFKSQGEIYYSAGQSTSDRQLTKYASQMIYLCDSYEDQINSGEGIDEESYSGFKSNVMGVLSKIDQYINGGDETIIVQNLEDTSYFEGKDELKKYIYDNR